MNKAIVSACVAFGLLHLSPATFGSTAEFVTEYGPAATFNGAEVRVFFSHNGSEIQTLGVEVPAAMFDGAPHDPPSDGRYDIPVDADDPSRGTAWHCCGYEIVADLPDSALQMTAFRKVVLNWNPQGHVPPGIYNVPHTDFHFYFMEEDERLGIGGARDASDMCVVVDPSAPDQPGIPLPQTCEQFAVTGADVPEDQLAPGYANLGATEPAMGNHLIDPASHEFHGESFTHTHIYMANAGHLTGMEPMITLDYLRGLTQPVSVPVTSPRAFPSAGLYPTEYTMDYDRENGVFRVSYVNWKAFPASSGLSAGIDTSQ